MTTFTVQDLVVTGALTATVPTAGSADHLSTGRTLSISGDMSWTSPSFDGSANVTAAGALATVNSNVGTFGSNTSIPTFVVNAKGLITAVSGNAVIAPASTLSGTTLNPTVVTSSLTSVGTLGSLNITSSGSQNSILVTDTGTNGANVELVGNGGTTPNKFIRAYSGRLEFLNSAYNTALMSVTDVGALTVLGAIAASNFSGSHSGTSFGTNTGDQSTISGNAGTATALQTGRTIAITGDLSWTSPSFDGSANVTAAGTLATVNSNVGTFGSGTSIPTLTVNGKGLVTAASGNSVVAPAGTLTGSTLASGVTSSSLTSFGATPTLVTPVLGAATGTSVTWSGNNTAAAFIPSGSTIPTNGTFLPAANTIAFSTNTTERARITSGGKLLIGATAQAGYGGTVPTVEAYSASIASSDSDGGSLSLLGLTNTSGAGGALVLGSLYNTGSYATFGRVRGVKSNSTAGDFGGGLALDTRPSAGSFIQSVLIDSTGQFALSIVGRGISIKEGTNAKQGKSTLTAGAVTVSTTAVTASSRIFVSINDTGSGVISNIGSVYVNNIIAGTSFDIRSSNALDTSSVVWLINEPS